MRELSGACGECGGPMDHRSKMCNRCRLRSLPSTPLRRWRTRTGRSYGWLARSSGLCRRTIVHVAEGKPMTSTTARLIHRWTGIPYAELMEGSS